MLRRSAAPLAMHSNILGDTHSEGTSSAEETLSSPTQGSPKLELSRDEKTITISTRRTTRTTVNSKRKLYDMSFHPMDSFTRPNPKRAKFDEVNNIESSALKSEAQRNTASETSSEGSLQGRSQNTYNDKNLFAEPIEEDWKLLNALDRRVYRLQRGSPIKGDAIALKWSTVIKTLIRENFFSREQCIMWGGEKALKARYEKVRKAMQVFFGGVHYEEEPCSRKNWTIRPMEGWDVFDLASSAIVRKTQSATKGHGSQVLDDADENYGVEAREATEDSENEASQTLDNASVEYDTESQENSAIGQTLYSSPTQSHQDDVSRLIGEPLMTQEEVEKAYEDHLSQEQVKDIVLSDHPTSSDTAPQVSAQLTREHIASSPPRLNIYEDPQSPSAKATARALSKPFSPKVDISKANHTSIDYNDIDEARKLLFGQFKAKDHTSQSIAKAASLSPGRKLPREPETPSTPKNRFLTSSNSPLSLAAPIVPKVSAQIPATGVSKAAEALATALKGCASSEADDEADSDGTADCED